MQLLKIKNQQQANQYKQLFKGYVNQRQGGEAGSAPHAGAGTGAPATAEGVPSDPTRHQPELASSLRSCTLAFQRDPGKTVLATMTPALLSTWQLQFLV